MTTQNQSDLQPTPAEAAKASGSELRSGDGFGVWVPVAERLPDHGRKVIACYSGVYDARVVTFWRDAGGNAHFGYPDSNPATHWMDPPLTPNDCGEPRPGGSA